MNKKLLKGVLGLVALASLLLVGCHHMGPDDWSFSKKTRTFSNANATVQIVKAKKIALPNGEKAVRIYYKVTNHGPEAQEGYPLILGAVDKVTQAGHQLETAAFDGQDADDKNYASKVTIKPRQTKEIVQDYQVTTFATAISFAFTDANYKPVASYTLSINKLDDAPITHIKISQSSTTKLATQ